MTIKPKQPAITDRDGNTMTYWGGKAEQNVAELIARLRASNSAGNLCDKAADALTAIHEQRDNAVKRCIVREDRITELEAENAALRELINDIAEKIHSMGTSVTVASFGNSLLNRIDAARKS